MLLLVSTCRVALSTSHNPRIYLLCRVPLSKRSASLTGAISRGTRKAQQAGERRGEGGKYSFKDFPQWPERHRKLEEPGKVYSSRYQRDYENGRESQRNSQNEPDAKNREGSGRKEEATHKVNSWKVKADSASLATVYDHLPHQQEARLQSKDDRGAVRGVRTEGSKTEHSARRSKAPIPSAAEKEAKPAKKDDGTLSTPQSTSPKAPVSIPRSKAASEFVYGMSAVLAALQAGRRQLYKLYIRQGSPNLTSPHDHQGIHNLASRAGLKVVQIGPTKVHLLDVMAQGRPHNGYVLEASAIPMTPVKALGRVTEPGEGFLIEAEHQSAEEIAVNGRITNIPVKIRRFPFVLMLDGIQDPGNLGAVVRSAAFFGIDAVAFVDSNVAPFSPVTIKASAGAAEYVQLLKIRRDVDWVKKSKANGWRFFAAMPPDGASAANLGRGEQADLDATAQALAKGPCVLMVGGESDGLRPRLQKVADTKVTIERATGVESKMGLDSLNVSVAAALLMQAFIRVSNSPKGQQIGKKELGSEADNGRLY